VPVLDKRPEPRRPRVSEPSGEREREAAPVEARPAPSGWTGKRKWAIALAAVSVAASGTGIGLGVHANSLESQADMRCPDTACPDPTAVDQNRSARRYALGANVGFAVGGAALAGAVVLWLVGSPEAPRRDEVSIVPTLAGDRVGISLARSF
jgi:hypothetical protein